MAILDLTAMNAALKELYDGQVVDNLTYSDNPTLAMLPKKTDFGGKYKPVPIITGNSQGRSASFANAQGNQTAVEIESFLITRAKDYSLATIDNETMLASATDKMSFLEGSKTMIDGAFGSITNSLSSAIFRSGTGSIAQIGSISTVGAGPFTATITLSNANDIVQVERGMTFCASATDGAAVRTPVGQVLTVNRSTGVFTATFAVTPDTVWVAGDFISVQGDLNAKVKGFAAWVPDADPSATAFFGVDRSVDTVRLGGLRVNASSMSIEEGMIDASSQLAREGGKPNYGVMTFASYAALEKSLGAKVQYVNLQGPAQIGFQGIVINGANTKINILADRYQRPQKCHLLQMSTWCLESLGSAPQILRYGDGLEMLRVNNADAGEVRIGYYAQLRTNAPGWNAVVSLSA